MLLQLLLWQSQSQCSVILMRMRWIPAESRKLWLCTIAFNGTPGVTFWLWMFWHGADTTLSTHGGCTTFSLAGTGCSNPKYTHSKLCEKGHNRNAQGCHWWWDSSVYSIFNSVKIKHCYVALSPPRHAQVIMLLLLKFLKTGNLTFRTVIYKSRL